MGDAHNAKVMDMGAAQPVGRPRVAGNGATEPVPRPLPPTGAPRVAPMAKVAAAVREREPTGSEFGVGPMPRKVETRIGSATPVVAQVGPQVERPHETARTATAEIGVVGAVRQAERIARGP